MNKLVAIVIITLCALLCCTSNAHAQGPLPRIGVLKWKIESPDINLSTAVAYARNAGRLFVGTWAGTILVVDTKIGRVVDTIKTSDYPEIWNKMKGLGQPIVRWLGTTDDGKLIVFGFNALNRTLMVDYPSRRLLDSMEMGIGQYNNWAPQDLFVSPKGTYVSMNGEIINRKNGLRWNVGLRQYRVSFDTAETVAAYNTVALYDGKSYIQFVNVQYLDDTARKPIQTNLWGIPTISADGQKLMTAGAAWAIDGISPDLPARAVVMNLNDGSIVWQIQGDRDSPNPYDFDRFAWNGDGTNFFGVRASPSLPDVSRTHLYRWAVGSPAPDAIVDNPLVNGWVFQPIFNHEMTEAYTLKADQHPGPVYAFDFTKIVSDVPSNTEHSIPDSLYPNPTTGMVTMRCSAVATPTEWSLITIDGRAVASGGNIGVVTSAFGGDLCHIALPIDLPTGQYFLTLRNNGAGSACTMIVVKQ